MTTPSPAQALAALPQTLRQELLDAFAEITGNFRASRWEPAELNGGKLSEIVYTIMRGHADGAFPSRASKPQSMVDACRSLENEMQLPRSFRILIPRLLPALYEVRNQRGVGHVGGDVNPNHMDAVFVMFAAKWIMAELVRVFHQLDTRTASAIVDALVERQVPAIWQIGSVRRVMAKGLTLKQQMLLLLYGAPVSVTETDVLLWLEKTKTASTFRRDVLRPAHRERLVEYDEQAKTVLLSPLGIDYVEKNLPLAMGGAA
jgi:hypothetical protein